MTQTALIPDISVSAYRQRTSQRSRRRSNTDGRSDAHARLALLPSPNSNTSRSFNHGAGPGPGPDPLQSKATFDVTHSHKQRQTRIAIELAVTHVFGVAHGAITQDARGASRVSLARQVAMYLAHVSCGLSLTEVGRMFDRDRTTVAHGCLKVEMRRDTAQFDKALDLLGWAIPALIQRRHVDSSSR